MGLLNLILAVIVDRAAEARTEDKEHQANLKRQEQTRAKDEFVKICHMLDTDDSNTLTVNELRDAFENGGEFKTVMDIMDVGVHDLDVVFDMFDSDKNGFVTYDEFATNLFLMKNLDQQTLLSFIKHHLNYFLTIVTLSLNSEPSVVTEEEFDLLGLVMCAGTSKTSPLWRASEAMPEFAQKGSLPIAEVKKQALKILTWNDDVYTTNNAQPIPEPVSKTLNVLNLHKATWFHRPHNAEIDYLNIVDCKDSTIYVTARIAFCLISGCEGSTIVLGAVSTLCTAQNCEKVTIHVAAHCYKMENCVDTSSYLYCHIPPIITGDTRGVKLAPYNVLHSRLDACLEGAQVPLKEEFVDVWAHPVCCTAGMDDTLRSRITTSEDGNSTYHFVHPSKFFPVVVPELGPRGEAPSLVLPEVYAKAMREQAEEMQAFNQQFSSISNDAARRKAHDAVQNVFKEWLQSTGKTRQLSDLAKFSMQFQQKL